MFRQVLTAQLLIKTETVNILKTLEKAQFLLSKNQNKGKEWMTFNFSIYEHDLCSCASLN